MKKLINKEIYLYLIFGVFTTIVYFITRFFISNLTGQAILAVVIAQLTAIVFAFFTNKYFVFFDSNSSYLLILKQFLIFFSGRLFVFGLDLIITLFGVKLYSDYFIKLFFLDKLTYDHPLFSSQLTSHFIGTPALLNEFIWAFLVQVLAIVINYVISKRKVFKKD